MPVEASDALFEITGQLKGVLDSNLSGELSTMASTASGNYPLPAPETYVLGKVETADAFRRLNVDEVACWVTQSQASSTVEFFSGTPGEHKKDIATVFRVGLMIRQRSGLDPMPSQWPDGTGLGRELVMEEFQTARGQLYKGAIMDAVTDGKPMQGGSASVGDVRIDKNFADTVSGQNDLYARAIVDFKFEQQTTVER